MWSEAAKALRRYDEAVLTAIDTQGYPFSVRVRTADYDPTTGVLTAELPTALAPAAGPANLLCHFHDDKMWNIRTLHVRGRLERRDDAWDFVSTAFTAPSRLAPLAMIRNANASARRYLARRGLDRPAVDWAAVKEMQRRVDEQR
ncbi:hypothetical protein AB0K11_00330 [Mycobacterium sp. NPDC050551]|uniref:hypothetical protein n=1 Tax=Mycobacterium sp. NPDC050551 TaxID=3155407 RepID=UPI0034235621